MSFFKVNPHIFRRRNFLIKPDYQLRVIVGVLISIVVYSGLLGFFIFYPLAEELFSSVSIAERGRVSEAILLLHESVWPGVLIVSVLIAIQVVLSTHRVAGPLYRFDRAIDELLSGDFSKRTTLRKGDRFKETEGRLNLLADCLEVVRDMDLLFHEGTREALLNVSSLLEKGDDASLKDAKRVVEEMERRAAEYDGAFPAVAGGSGQARGDGEGGR